MTIKPLINAFLACLALGPMIAGAKAAECDGAITADEALKAEDSRYAAQTKSDFDALQRLYGDDLVYVHSAAVVDNKASYIDRQRSRPALSRDEAERRQSPRLWLPCDHHGQGRL